MGRTVGIRFKRCYPILPMTYLTAFPICRGSAARAFHATASTFDEARCPYAVLDLDPGASQKEVKKAYMVLVYHSESSHSFPCPVVLYGRHRDTCICRRGSCILTFRHTSTRRKNSPRSIVRTRCSQTRRLDDSMMLGRLIPKVSAHHLSVHPDGVCF